MKNFISLSFLLLSACGARIDLSQKYMTSSDFYKKITNDANYKKSKNDDGKKEDTAEENKDNDIVNPEDANEIEDIDDNIEHTAQDKDSQFPLVQRQTIVLKDGRKITINNADIVHDSERLQIRKTADLTYIGAMLTKVQISQTGLITDEKKQSIFPVILLNHGQKTNDIPEGGIWRGQYYGQFQAQKNSYDIFGQTKAKVNLKTQKISGFVDNLSITPALTSIPPLPANGSIYFNGDIKDGQWYGNASSQGILNPETKKAFKETSGHTQGVFITASDNPATEAAGYISLKDTNNKGLIGTINMQHSSD